MKGIPATRRERIETAVEAAGRHVAVPHEAWIAADPFRGGSKVLITVPHGLERSVGFTLDEEPGTITRSRSGRLWKTQPEEAAED